MELQYFIQQKLFNLTSSKENDKFARYDGESSMIRLNPGVFYDHVKAEARLTRLEKEFKAKNKNRLPTKDEILSILDPAEDFDAIVSIQ